VGTPGNGYKPVVVWQQVRHKACGSNACVVAAKGAARKGVWRGEPVKEPEPVVGMWGVRMHNPVGTYKGRSVNGVQRPGSGVCAAANVRAANTSGNGNKYRTKPTKPRYHPPAGKGGKGVWATYVVWACVRGGACQQSGCPSVPCRRRSSRTMNWSRRQLARQTLITW